MPPKKETSGTKLPSKEEVIAYLRANPRFFEENVEALEAVLPYRWREAGPLQLDW